MKKPRTEKGIIVAKGGTSEIVSFAAIVFSNVPPGSGGGLWDGSTPAISFNFQGPT